MNSRLCPVTLCIQLRASSTSNSGFEGNLLGSGLGGSDLGGGGGSFSHPLYCSDRRVTPYRSTLRSALGSDKPGRPSWKKAGRIWQPTAPAPCGTSSDATRCFPLPEKHVNRRSLGSVAKKSFVPPFKKCRVGNRTPEPLVLPVNQQKQASPSLWPDNAPARAVRRYRKILDQLPIGNAHSRARRRRVNRLTHAWLSLSFAG
jgi:hypothetical protein